MCLSQRLLRTRRAPAIPTWVTRGAMGRPPGRSLEPQGVRGVASQEILERAAAHLPKITTQLTANARGRATAQRLRAFAAQRPPQGASRAARPVARCRGSPDRNEDEEGCRRRALVRPLRADDRARPERAQHSSRTSGRASCRGTAGRDQRNALPGPGLGENPGSGPSRGTLVLVLRAVFHVTSTGRLLNLLRGLGAGGRCARSRRSACAALAVASSSHI